MGITGYAFASPRGVQQADQRDRLWGEIGDGELIPLAQLSTQYFARYGRPFRIAVDEAGWRFNNLTPQQVAAIKAKEPAARPVEKAIFHRIVSLLQLNIQLLFVFDGPQRPWKRGGRGGHQMKWNETRETRELLTRLSIPYHIAPGEAEAECSLLQQEGIVDAVWTDDGDALMFGTTMLIRTHREKSGEKSKTHVSVYRADDIKHQYGLDQDGFLLFALLAGGDYEVQGLPGCGAKTAIKLAREGVLKSLRSLRASSMHVWRRHLQIALRGKCEVPPDFPNMRVLNYYMKPTVSSHEQLHNLRGLAKGWTAPLKEVELRSFLRTHYNIQIKGYLKHIIPMLLLRTLCATIPGREHTNNIYGIELAKIRRNKNDREDTVSLIRKITYLPQQVTSLDLSSQPGGPDGEDWTTMASKDGFAFDATARINCEMLDYALQRGVPHVLQEGAADFGAKIVYATNGNETRFISRKSSRKRKTKPEIESTYDAAKRMRKTHSTHRTNDALAAITADQNPNVPKVRSTFRLPPQLDLAINPSEKKSQPLESNTRQESARTIVPPQRMLHKKPEPLDQENELPSQVHEMPPGTDGSQLTGEIPSAEIRARRLAHFKKVPTSIPPSGSGDSIADAIVLD